MLCSGTNSGSIVNQFDWSSLLSPMAIFVDVRSLSGGSTYDLVVPGMIAFSLSAGRIGGGLLCCLAIQESNARMTASSDSVENIVILSME